MPVENNQDTVEKYNFSDTLKRAEKIVGGLKAAKERKIIPSILERNITQDAYNLENTKEMLPYLEKEYEDYQKDENQESESKDLEQYKKNLQKRVEESKALINSENAGKIELNEQKVKEFLAENAENVFFKEYFGKSNKAYQIFISVGEEEYSDFWFVLPIYDHILNDTELANPETGPLIAELDENLILYYQSKDKSSKNKIKNEISRLTNLIENLKLKKQEKNIFLEQVTKTAKEISKTISPQVKSQLTNEILKQTQDTPLFKRSARFNGLLDNPSSDGKSYILGGKTEKEAFREDRVDKRYVHYWDTLDTYLTPYFQKKLEDGYFDFKAFTDSFNEIYIWPHADKKIRQEVKKILEDNKTAIDKKYPDMTSIKNNAWKYHFDKGHSYYLGAFNMKLAPGKNISRKEVAAILLDGLVHRLENPISSSGHSEADLQKIKTSLAVQLSIYEDSN